jgi:SAM-dependent methyltransferase
MLRFAVMRVIDLDRDMSDVIPTGTTPDSEYLFARMTDVTLDLTRAAPGKRVLDVASGVGQDAIALAARGATVVGAEPSARMTGMAQLFSADKDGPIPAWIRGWSDSLPFAADTFDASICKGAIDHFDRPESAVAEMARVTRRDGRVVLAIANFESLACRLGRAQDDANAAWSGSGMPSGRRGYDAPSDHFTRYELDLMREQADRHLELEVVEGVSLGWGAPGWSKAMTRLPEALATLALQMGDRVARAVPSLADVIVLAGRPRRSASTSA